MPELYIGLMSGTSLDGVDAVLAAAHGDRLRLLESTRLPFPASLRERVLGLHRAGHDELRRAALLANELSALYARAVRRLLARAGVSARSITAIGCHGQTIRHRPRAGYTLQLVNGAALAEATGISVVCDFRSRDIAAGGEGAPLVPAFHSAVFGSNRGARVVVNVGGIANLTRLPVRGSVIGFDCGPGNCLLDAWIQRKRHRPFDAGGSWASRGRIVSRLLGKLLKHPFLRRKPPKSTGRDEFDLRWLQGVLTRNERPVDVQATLLEFTSTTIARSVRTYGGGAREIFVCGGGARNRALLARLAALLPDRHIATTAALGVDPGHVEALAFAWLARRALKGKPGNLPAVTGARGPRVLGTVYPR